MRVLTGQYERTIDSKGRIQLPAQLRSAIDATIDGSGLYVQLGERRNTLSIYTERAFNELSARIPTENMAAQDSQDFELQFYSQASHVDVDPQGRFVLPERLRRKARLGEEVYLVGQKQRIDVWNRTDLDRAMGIDWEGEDWPNWRKYLRMGPGQDQPRS